MSVLSQSTIANKYHFQVLEFIRQKVNINLLPSAPNTGIVFKRIDLKYNNIIVPNFNNVTEATLHDNFKSIWSKSFNN